MQLARERFEGYIQAMKEHNIPVQEKYVLRGDFTMETAYKLVKECLKEGTVRMPFYNKQFCYHRIFKKQLLKII